MLSPFLSVFSQSGDDVRLNAYALTVSFSISAFIPYTSIESSELELHVYVFEAVAPRRNCAKVFR